LYFLYMNTGRELICDSCATGMGQGAGNLQTELIVPYLIENFGKEYNFESVLEICDILDCELIPNNLWGYSVTRLIPALYKSAYKYALMMRNKYHLSFKEMNTVFKYMPDELRNRYTESNLENAIKDLENRSLLSGEILP